MTNAEFLELIQRILSQSRDVNSLEEATSLEHIKSLPAVDEQRQILVSVPFRMIVAYLDAAIANAQTAIDAANAAAAGWAAARKKMGAGGGSGGGGESADIDPDLLAQIEALVDWKPGVDEQLQELYDALFPFSIKTFTGGGTYELGSSQNITLTWTYAFDEIDSQKLNGVDILPLNTRRFTYTAVTRNTTYTLVVVYKGKSFNKSVSVSFKLRKYYGVSAKTSLNNTDILSLQKAWADGYTMSEVSLNCTGGRYIYYVIPTSLAPASLPDFRVGGFSNSDWIVDTMEVTNSSGYSANYTIYRLRNIQTGNPISLQVK